MSTTMLPFLYQTRTLSGLLMSTQGSFRQIPRPNTISRYLTASTRRPRTFDPSSIPTTTAAKPGSSEDNKNPLRKAASDLQSNGNTKSIPITPRGRGIYDGGRHTSRAIPTQAADDFDDEFSMPDTIDFEEANGNKYLPRESTITSREKQAFQKIFSDIFERTRKANSIAQEDKELANSQLNIAKTTKDSREKAQVSLKSILTGAMQKQPKTQLEIEEAISKYPPALREDAAKAMRLGNDSLFGNEEENEEVNQEEEQATKEAMRLKAEELEALRAPERLRVETLMREAKTDFELWEVMEKEVFSMISKLGLEDNQNVPGAPKPDKTKKGWKKLQKKLEAEQQPKSKAQDKIPYKHVEKETINGIPLLQLYGPLYPSYLLLGLRLLDRSFARPSPLALSILPKIKSLGFISHVLGASTGFYNDLLRIYRYRYDDFRGMLALMGEMEQSALDMDEETLTIVLDVMQMQTSVKNNERGGSVASLWHMPEFAPGKFVTWREKIYRGIEERKQNATTRIY